MSEIAQTNQKEPPSLAAAYWIYGVAANIAFGILVGGIWSTAIPPGPCIAWVAYNVWNALMVWDAAGRYAGWRFWAGLAKAITVINAAILALASLALFKVLLDRINDLQPGGEIIWQLLWQT